MKENIEYSSDTSEETGKVKTKEELNDLKDNIKKPMINIFNEIKDYPGLPDEKILNNINNKIESIPNQEMDPTLREHLKKGDISNAIKEVFNILSRFFQGGGVNNEKIFEEVNNELQNLRLEEKNLEEIANIIKTFEKKIETTPLINKKILNLFSMSKAKDHYLNKKENHQLNGLQLLNKNMSVGSIILLNKETKKQDIGANLLKSFDSKYQKDFTHSMMVSKIDDNGEIRVAHSTGSKISDNNETGVEEIKRSDYTKYLENNCKKTDFILIEPPIENKEKSLSFIQDKIKNKSKYDSLTAIGGAIGVKNNDTTFNCVELIAEGIGIESIKNITHPNEFLGEKHLKLEYMTTISRS